MPYVNNLHLRFLLLSSSLARSIFLKIILVFELELTIKARTTLNPHSSSQSDYSCEPQHLARISSSPLSCRWNPEPWAHSASTLPLRHMPTLTGRVSADHRTGSFRHPELAPPVGRRRRQSLAPSHLCSSECMCARVCLGARDSHSRSASVCRSPLYF